MHPQVVQNQKDFPARILNQRLHELDQPIGIEGLIDDHPTRLAPVGDAGDHGQLLACAAHRVRHRCCTCRGVAPAAHVGVDQCRLVAPVNLASFSLGLRFDGRVVLIESSDLLAPLMQLLQGLVSCAFLVHAELKHNNRRKFTLFGAGSIVGAANAAIRGIPEVDGWR